MLFPPHGMIGRFLQRRSVARWRAATRDAETTRLTDLEQQVAMAKQTSRRIRDFRAAASSRLSAPRRGQKNFPTPTGTDWQWRPKPWAFECRDLSLAPARAKDSITNELVIFHDCPLGEVSLTQSPNMRNIDLSAHIIALEVFHFAGSYLSLVIEIPASSCEGLKKSHLIRLQTTIERERPTPIYARLNIKHGPNTEQILLTLPDDDEAMVEFDLAYSQLIAERAERMWIDLMIGAPAMNKILVRDLTLSRYPRAEI
ncbi:DUF6478 family protein [Yoonia litorea]|uniref:Uncharacterized protein n=1 Tax=Yoonia litorea TaxID=1123755 RepID=A0A1I6N2F7_9RHOB|nr:DUF6478 family protein [Yoonia litorea]SFS22152.1 hypothetical protein SAMN05444714_3164 [Yoonia litorea]